MLYYWELKPGFNGTLKIPWNFDRGSKNDHYLLNQSANFYSRAFGDGPRNFEPSSSYEGRRHLSWYPPLLTATPHQREDVQALDRFDLQRDCKP
ncbi:hypothetical protein TNCV_1805101 [Trichonephila clavipes]|nr:hypothetical protein TNCV_1805101 [Trichonephila clavipes]